MYTTFPLETIDTINNHTGFWLWLVFVLVVMISMISSYGFDDEPGTPLILTIITAIVAGISWNTGEVIVYANTPVQATLVGFQAEGYNEQRGKSRADQHYKYVVYSTPDGNVMFPATTGIAYPPVAMLYKNLKK